MPFIKISIEKLLDISLTLLHVGLDKKPLCFGNCVRFILNIEYFFDVLSCQTNFLAYCLYYLITFLKPFIEI